MIRRALPVALAGVLGLGIFTAANAQTAGVVEVARCHFNSQPDIGRNVLGVPFVISGYRPNSSVLVTAVDIQCTIRQPGITWRATLAIQKKVLGKWKRVAFGTYGPTNTSYETEVLHYNCLLPKKKKYLGKNAFRSRLSLTLISPTKDPAVTIKYSGAGIYNCI